MNKHILLTFFRQQGATSICSAFTKEITENGRLSERGDPTIDKFVAVVNAVTLEDLSMEAREVARDMIEYCVERGIRMGDDDGLKNLKAYGARKELEEFIYE